jgi:arabinogalactan oligomer/maltooligosaccharide transport system permease protein
VSTVARTEPGPRRGAANALSLPSRAMAFFSGGVGLAVKLALLTILNAIALWAVVVLAGDHKWIACVVLVASTLAIDAVYLIPKRTIPAKFLVPGTVFLLAFQVVPIIYTINTAFTNYSTGHVITKEEAISTIEERSLVEIPEGASFTMTPARDADGNLVLLLVNDDTQRTFVGTQEGLKPLARTEAQVSPDGFITGAEGYTVVAGAEAFVLEQELQELTVPTVGKRAIQPEGLEAAIEVAPTLRYVEARDVFVGLQDRKVYRDNGEGSYATASGEELEPGWKTYIGTENFSRVFNDPLVRDPFIRVFIWTFIFATVTVFFSFAIGLFLAIALEKPFHGQRLYRTILVIPWAIPGFLTILVWAGLLNDDFGVVNQILPAALEKPWLFDPFWAKMSCLIVSTWLTFPYFFLVSLGALQSIPGELVEAARVDGGGGWAIFRRITLPLLLVAVAPLLIASFAFNFNNFNNIFLLTGGGPPDEEGSVAGSTDILISYTYKIALESGKGQDYALACTITLFIFVIVATISALAFWRTASLENVK